MHAMLKSGFAAACAAGLFIAGAAVAAPVNHTVVIEGVKYSPDTLTVAKGDTVEWVNKDAFPHTVTSKGKFDSKDIAPGKSWKYTAGKAGVYSYACNYHPIMQGTLTVK